MLVDEIRGRGDEDQRQLTQEERHEAKVAERADPRLFKSSTKPIIFQLDRDRDNFEQWRSRAWKAYVEGEGIWKLEAPDDALTDNDATKAIKASKRKTLKMIWMTALHAAVDTPTLQLMWRLHVIDRDSAEENLDALQTYFAGKTNDKVARKHMSMPKRKTNESAEDFIIALNTLADKCRWTAMTAEEAREDELNPEH